MIRNCILLQLIAICTTIPAYALVPLANQIEFADSIDVATESTQVEVQTVATMAEESYKLEVGHKIVIQASSDAGVFYAQQTLAQLAMLHPEGIPFQTINDAPRFAYRASMIDVARHFRSIDYLKLHIQRMAYFKLNVLHLHLSDDQGWRVEILGWPNLTLIGGSTAVGGDKGGYYSQAELRDLIAFAAQYHVMIVPEIDMPGHIQAALASYPQLACDGANTQLYTGMKVGFSHLCLDKPDVVYPFVDAVLTKLSALFVSPYFHIGGDETDIPQYNEFIELADKRLISLGKTMIGWEEIAKANLSSNTVVHYWQPKEEYLNIAKAKKLPVILSPCANTYLDHGNYAGQRRTTTWCNKNGVSLENVYQLRIPENTHVIGIEAHLWGEFIRTDADADNRLWPRLAAIADLAWSGQGEWHEFKLRMAAFQPWFKQHKIQYYPEPVLGWQ